MNDPRQDKQHQRVSPQGEHAQNGAEPRSQIIEPPSELQEKCLRPGNASLAALEAISNAEAALEELSVNFQHWMDIETGRLSDAHARLRQEGLSERAIENLFEAAHDLKGQGSTLGYPLAADVSASLCRLLEAFTNMSRLPMSLVDHHVDAVKAMVRENAMGTDNNTAVSLSERLRTVTDEVIAREERQSSKSAAA